jgi:hypothetical protein
MARHPSARPEPLARRDTPAIAATRSRAEVCATTGAGPMAELVASFAKSGQLPGAADVAPRAVGEGRPSIAVAVSLGSVAKASTTHLLAYDEVGSVLYFGKTLQPYWKRGGATIADAIHAALKDQAGK